MTDVANSPAEAAAWLSRNAVDSLPAGALTETLTRAAAAGRPLRVKLGIDPTAPDIHLGHAVVLGKLREFQDLGHEVVLIIGDYTARVGDPSGRSKTRPVLAPEEIEANARTFQDQAGLILSPERIEVRHNSEWLDMPLVDLLALVRTTTVGQILERDDFAKRMARSEPVSVLELLYPLLQGYDSVAVRADVELGGTDQTFNLLLGRDIQRAYGQPEQAILTMPLLVGTDGVNKMSKSLGNHIGVTEPPEEIYGKTMSVPDEALPMYFELLLGIEPPSGEPYQAKRALAAELVRRLHGDGAAAAAAAHFDRVVVGGGPPEAVPEYPFVAGEDGRAHLPVVIEGAFGRSRSEARRLIDQGAVSLDGETVDAGAYDLDGEVLDGAVLRAGRRRYVRLRQAS
ncbi:MAG TPA: tyrosine--tRNA ligase [Solirubrobacteraceae bacterium]|nr:tyrosine--tRNA ligase [Solirubrobacteraceae bacterium]